MRHASARLADGKVLIVGGSPAAGVTSRSADIFDPATGGVTAAIDLMNEPRAGATATTLIDGRVLVVGGSNGLQELATAELYYPGGGFLPVETTLGVARAGHTALLLATQRIRVGVRRCDDGRRCDQSSHDDRCVPARTVPGSLQLEHGDVRSDRGADMWGTDATAAVTLMDGAATIFAAIDHCTAECVGIHAATHGDRFEALEPIRQGVRDHFGGLAPATAAGLMSRSGGVRA